MRFLKLFAVVGVWMSVTWSPSLEAQENGSPNGAPPEAEAGPINWPASLVEVPWGPGERLTYKLKFGWFDAGHGVMSVEDVENVRGKASYLIRWSLDAGALGLTVRDRFYSYVDIENLTSRRFIQDIHELSRKRYFIEEIYPEEGRWERLNTPRAETMEATQPLDEIAFVYFARTLPLQVGDVDTIPRYFKDDGNPVILKTLRTETIEVPAGTFETVVVQPLIKTSGLFSEGGEAELHFTNDERRILVYMRTKLSIGSLTLHLESAEDGTPLTPEFLRNQSLRIRE